MAILAMQAGKHVYLEKPSSHNPREAELLDAAQKKYNRVVQLGTQQRSSPRTIEALAAIKDGVIGAPYLTRAWYANTRVGIGKGKPAPGSVEPRLRRCGRDPRRARRTTTTTSTTTGTGSAAGARARSTTTARTRSTSRA